MSFISENVIPGNHGKIFETNAKKHEDLIGIKDVISKINGIKDVIIDEDKFPREFTIHTRTLVAVKDIQDVVIRAGFHALPKSLFQL